MLAIDFFDATQWSHVFAVRVSELSFQINLDVRYSAGRFEIRTYAKISNS